MTDTKKTAPAEQSPAPEKAEHIYTGTLRPERDGETKSPHLFTTGDTPKKGSRIKFRAQGGKLCTGIVKDAVSADGELLIQFRGGIEAVQK